MGFDAEVTPVDGLRTDEYLLRPISADDAALDYDAVMESKESLRKWEQSSWPADDFTVDANRRDLEKLERRHQRGEAYGYTVMNLDESVCLGCVYVIAPDAPGYDIAEKTAIAGRQWADVRLLVAFWVRESRLAAGLDGRLLHRLRTWFRDDWRIAEPLIVTSEHFEQQVGLIEGTELELQFRLTDPNKAGDTLAYG